MAVAIRKMRGHARAIEDLADLAVMHRGILGH